MLHIKLSSSDLLPPCRFILINNMCEGGRQGESKLQEFCMAGSNVSQLVYGYTRLAIDNVTLHNIVNALNSQLISIP